MINKVEAIVLFVKDLPVCTAFYRDTFTLPSKGGDARSAVFGLQDGLVLLLLSPEATADLLATTVDALKLEGGPRGLLAVSVANVDGTYADLQSKGVTLVRPPTDQPWGLRTAHFTDPEGNLWEINQPIVSKPAE